MGRIGRENDNDEGHGGERQRRHYAQRHQFLLDFHIISILCVHSSLCARGRHKIYRTIVGRWSDCLEEKSSNLQFLSVVYLHMSCEFRLERDALLMYAKKLERI